MFALWLLAFSQTNNLFNETGLTLLPQKQTLSSLSAQWYYVYIKSYKDISRIKSALPDLKISPLNINGNCLTLFLKTFEVKTLSQISNIRIYIKAPKKVAFSTLQKNETYLVYADSSFTAPKYSKTISQSGPYYFISTSHPTIIENDPNVLSIQKVPHIRTMNRWTTGYLQSGDPNYIFKNGYYTSNRKYNERGLNGSNIIVTVIDTGVLVNNCFFYDKNFPNFLYNTTNYEHKKIVRYDIFTNNFYKNVRHGTHTAGIIAGFTDSIPMNLYNGHAPASKLYVGDIGTGEDEDIDVSLTFEIFNQTKKLNSPIISCSWGDPETTAELTEMFDHLSYQNPSQLFVFAAGNDYMYYRIGSPENSKNVLTVAASDPPRSFYLSDSSHIIKIVDGNEFLNVTSPNIFSAMKSHQISFLQDIETIIYDDTKQASEYSNKAVILSEYKESDYYFHYKNILDLLASNNAKVAIVFDQSWLNHDDMYIINVDSQNKPFFDNHNKITITIELPEKTKEIGIAEYSSRGPTKFGNRKPDIMAPGSYITSASSRKDTNVCDEKLSLLEMSGTSMATPAISGSMALIYQYLNESIHGLPFDKTKKITSALLRAFAIAGSGDQANVDVGYGSLNLSKILVYPNLDFGFGIRFYSDKIDHDEFISFFVKTDHVGPLSVTIAWIDVPIKLNTLYPLYSYFEFYVIGPNGVVYDVEEQFSTTKKIVINDAAVGDYEIRIRMNQIVPEIENPVDYSLVIVGPFDQLDFNKNPSELVPKAPKSCTSKCRSNNCNSIKSTCICDKLHTGTNCEHEIIEIIENNAIKHQMKKREFFFTHLDLSKYKNKLNEIELSQLTLSIKMKSDNYVYSNGFVRFFINNDNKMPLTMPNNFVQMNNDVDSQLDYPLSQMTENNDLYLTIFNDYGIDISFSLNWTVKKSPFSTKNNGNEVIIDDQIDEIPKFTETKTFKILMLALIVAGGVAVISILVFLIVKVVKNKKNKKHSTNNYQQYTDAGPNNQLNITLIDDV